MGDGSYTITLEKRGYVLANAWTPESSVEHPDAVRQLAIEFARAGADITQTYTFFSDDQRLKEWHGDNVPKVRKIKIETDAKKFRLAQNLAVNKKSTILIQSS